MSNDAPLPHSQPVFLPMVQPRPRWHRWLLFGGIAFVIIFAIILDIHFTAGLAAPANYSAVAPGPNCAQGEAIWRKTHDVTVQCAVDGTLLTMPHPNGTAQFIAFTPSLGSIPTSYRVSVNGTFTQGDVNEVLYIGVHTTEPNVESGDQRFMITANSEWLVRHYDTSGHFTNHLSRGFLPNLPHTVTMQVEVDGAVMYFTLNGRLVTTVTDTSYLSTAQIIVGMEDPQNAQSYAAHFAHFAYHPLPDQTLTPSQAQATATAQIAQQNKTPYQATVPGFGCDHGAGEWAPITLNNDPSVKLTCQADGMHLAETKQTGYLGEENFYWLNGNFPTNYHVSSTITFDGQHFACGLILTRVYDSASYEFAMCNDGSWQIAKYNAQAHFTVLTSGDVAQQTQHTLSATVEGNHLRIAVDGYPVGQADDSDLTTSLHIGLAIDTGSNTDGIASVTFSQFVFTPLP